MEPTIEELKKTYPDIDINMTGESDSFKEGLPIVERDPIAVIIKHPTEDSYLISQWKKSAWNGFLTGGIEDGDTLEKTVAKEIREETGFTHIKTIKDMHFVSHGLFFHPVKQVNRLAHYHLIFVELANLEHVEVSEEEKAIADFAWIPREEVRVLLTRNDMKLLWDFYIRNV